MNETTKLHRFRYPERDPIHVRALDALPWRVLAVALSFGMGWWVVFGASGAAGYMGGFMVAELIRLTMRRG